MRRLIVQIVFTVAVFQSLHAEPTVAWAEFVGHGEKVENLRAIQKGECLPDAKRINVPIASDAKVFFVSWKNKERPRCKNGEVSIEPIDSIVFLSKENTEVLVSWYRTTLAGMGFYEYTHRNTLSPGSKWFWSEDEILGGRREAVVFLRRALEQFVWNEHIYSAPRVLIRKAHELWRLSGYETTIEVYKPAL